MSKCSTRAVLPRPVTMQNCSMPAARASSIAYWISGLSTIGSISLAIALVAGRNRVPRPATGRTALRKGLIIGDSSRKRDTVQLGRKQSWSSGRAGRCHAGDRAFKRGLRANASRTLTINGLHPRFARRHRRELGRRRGVYHASSTSRAWFIRAASQSEPPPSGWAPRINRLCAARISASLAPGASPSTW